MCRKPVAPLILVMSLLAAAPAFAIEAGQYASDAGTKLGRGALNAVTGWMEVPMQTVIGSKEDGVLGGVGGFFKGIGLGVARTLAGAFEIATFLVPVPDRFEPVMQPPTVFGNGSPPPTLGEGTTGSARSTGRPVTTGGPAHEQTPQAEIVSGDDAEGVRLSTPSTSGLAQGIPLKDVFFESGSAALRRDAREILLANAEWLRNHPDAEVTIEGYCDESGKSEYNQILGYRRARVVRDFLVASGIFPERIRIVSYGSDRPLVLGDEESWRRWNRRARFVVSMGLLPRGASLVRDEP